MVGDKYAERLAPEQPEQLQRLIRVGKTQPSDRKAGILLKSDDGWGSPIGGEPGCGDRRRVPGQTALY